MSDSVAIRGRVTIENSGEMLRALTGALRSNPASLSVDVSDSR